MPSIRSIGGPCGIALCACLLALSASCALDRPHGRCDALRLDGPPADASVILIVSDTMRRDRVGVYGGSASTPAFDRFARDHLLFERAFTQAPWTKPSIATLFTSLYPSQHGLASHPQLRKIMNRDSAEGAHSGVDVLHDSYSTLAEIMRDAGFRTAAFVSNPWMDRGFGFAQGFEVYQDSFDGWNVPGERVSRAGLQWVEGLAPGERFFLYLHYIDSHRPYGKLGDSLVAELEALDADAPRPHRAAMGLHRWLVNHPQQEFTQEGLKRLELMQPRMALIDEAYDRGVEAFDRALKLFLDGFSRHPSHDRTAILITSDHGEALYERGYGNHGLGLFDDESAIPLAAHLPGVRGKGRVSCPVGLIDVMPTLCTYLGVDCPETMFGRSLFADTGEGPAVDRVVTEGVMFKPRNRTIRDDNYKLFWEPDGAMPKRARAQALYHIATDPRERRNLLTPGNSTPELEELARKMMRELREAVPDFDRPAAELAPVDPQLEDRLRALGYLE
jgi:arylsulfatase